MNPLSLLLRGLPLKGKAGAGGVSDPVAPDWSFSNATTFYSDTAGTTPTANGDYNAIKRWNDPTSGAYWQWQSGETPYNLTAGTSRNGQRCIYLQGSEMQLFNGANPFRPDVDWGLAIAFTPLDNAGGQIKPFMRKGADYTADWVLRQYFKRTELKCLTNNHYDDTWDWGALVPHGPRVMVVSWNAATTTLELRLNNRVMATLTGSLPAADTLHGLILGDGIALATIEAYGIRAWVAPSSAAFRLAQSKALQAAHLTARPHVTVSGDSLTAFSRSQWVQQMDTDLVNAGISHTIVNCAVGGAAITDFPALAGNSISGQYPTREKLFIPDSACHSVLIVPEAVNELYLRWQAAGGGASGTYNAATIAGAGIGALQAVVQQAKADGYGVVIVANMYDCTGTYVPTDIKTAYNSQLAALFANAHPRVTNVKTPTASSTYTGDFMVDWRAIPQIGPDGASADGTYFQPDGIHEETAAAPLKSAPFTALLTDFLTHSPF